MKRITLLLIFVWTVGAIVAQAPYAFKYQAVARSASGDLIVNQGIGVQVNILQNSVSGTVVYSEDHFTNTNQYGLVDLEIGNGANKVGTLQTVNWSVGTYYLRIKMDLSGGSNFVEMGVSQLLSVPYALYSAISGTTLQDQGIPQYSQSEIDTLSAISGLVVYNTNTHCLNLFNGTDWMDICGGQECTPLPSQAYAGTDQDIYGTSTSLSAGAPNYSNNEIGVWSVLSGQGATLPEPGNPTSTFSGTMGESYILLWTISTACGSTSDSVSINLLFCDDNNPCTYDYYLNGTCQFDIIVLNTADAGADQIVYGSSANLQGNTPVTGTGQWNNLSSGVPGSFSNINDPHATFSGVTGFPYTLRWTIIDSCGTHSDDVSILFYSCNDNDVCTEDIYNPSTDTCQFIPIVATTANAGPDQMVYSISGPGATSLAGNTPLIGLGTWEIVGGGTTGTSLTNINDPSTSFSGLINTEYVLTWTIQYETCTPTVDTVVVHFTNCESTDPCVEGIYNGQTGQCEYSPIVPTLADAGDNQSIFGVSATLSVSLNANQPIIGQGFWTIVDNKPGGIINNTTLPSTTFTGDANETYYLVWHINHNCGNSTDTVKITLSNCYNPDPCFEGVYNSQTGNCDQVPVVPTIANAGPDQSVYGTTSTLSTQLAANTPVVGSGVWQVISGANGAPSANTNPTAYFTGQLNTEYTLVWSINHDCSSSSDTVVIFFTDCSTSDPCYNNYYNPQTGQCEQTLINPTPANAGGSQEIYGNSTTLYANQPLIGDGSWSIVDGQNGVLGNQYSNFTSFSGTDNTIYTLVWSIGTPCVVKTDTITVHFFNCDDGNNCTVDEYVPGTNSCLFTPIVPSIAEAGADQRVFGTTGLVSTTLDATPISVGFGQWNMISGNATGDFSDPGNPAAIFTGTVNTFYELVWSVTHDCGPTYDTVQIEFTNCENADPCTEGFFNQQTNTCEQIAITPTLANAGADQLYVSGTISLDANEAVYGVGTWSVVGGANGQIGSVSDPKSTFTGTTGTIYELVWTIDHPCSSSSDTVLVSYELCDPMPSQANAGNDNNYVSSNQIWMNATPPTSGSGQWTILEGQSGQFANDTLYNSQFTGLFFEPYVFLWTVSTACGSTSDTCTAYFHPCTPPSDAVAGTDSLEIPVDTIVLAATSPQSGSGYWQSISGAGGSFSNTASANSTFYGVPGNTYVLVWSVSNSCTTLYDTITVSFYLCSPAPTQANAGNYPALAVGSQVLAGNDPGADTGLWSVAEGENGSFSDANSPTSTFYGTEGETYKLVWSITNNCGTSSDTAEVSFYICQPQPTTPFAGNDQLNVPASVVTLSANTPDPGVEAVWSVVAGAGGTFADTTSANTTFTGVPLQTYILAWTTSNSCGSLSDELQVTFVDTSTFECGSALTDVRDNETYGTVLINGVCWMTESLNHGTYIPSTQEQSDNSLIEKYCYDDNTQNCDTLGGLYAWDELMQYETAESMPGICPSGWRVPTDGDWFAMESFLDQTITDPFQVGSRGTNLASKLYYGGSSGLDLVYSGILWATTVGSTFYGYGYDPNHFGDFATSTINPASTQQFWKRSVLDGQDGVSRSAHQRAVAVAVRCIRDAGSVPCSPEPSQANAGPDQIVPSTSTVLAASAPIEGTGFWSIFQGNNGQLSDLTSPTSQFSGQSLEGYQLVWTVTNNCGSTSDTVNITFADTSNFACGQALVDVRDGKTYNTVEIDGSCWMAENLDHGTFINSSTVQSNNSTIEKYCYNDDNANCSTLGGLYSWNELMEYSNTEAGQGICPDGWHIPTDAEWYSLENFLDPTISDPNATDYRGTQIALKMLQGGSSGLDVLYGGIFWQANTFYGADAFWTKFTELASSSEADAGNAWMRNITEGNSGVKRASQLKGVGFSVRCVKISNTPPCSPEPSPADAGSNQTNLQNDSTTLGANNPAEGTGQWSITSGQGGSFSDAGSNTSIFYGIPGETYTLEWTISNSCGNNSDEITISFAALASFSCGNNLIDLRDNTTYGTIEINEVCWMTENLNYGTYVNVSQGQSNNNVAEKYCYENNQANCTSYGGLYTWDEIMQYSTQEGAQGLCPIGWTIPTDAQWFALESYLDNTITDPNATEYRGTTIAAQLVDGGSSGIDLLYSGAYYQPNNAFYGNNSGGADYANYWSSTQVANFTSNAWVRGVIAINNGAARNGNAKQIGNPVRCVLDLVVPPCSPYPSQADAGPDQTITDADSAILAANTPSIGAAYWTILSGDNGSFVNDTLNNTVFYGATGITYQLQWAHFTPCDTTFDVVQIEFPREEFNCGDTLVDSRDNKSYPTVELNGRCWMGANLNHGTFVNASTGQNNNSVIEKFCYNNDTNRCEQDGGLYHWNELMQYSTQNSAQGICPDGWHVPSDLEWYLLENELDPTVDNPTTIGERGTTIGQQLKVGGSSGMELVVGGFFYSPEYFYNGDASFSELFGLYATSTHTGYMSAEAYLRSFSSEKAIDYRQNSPKTTGVYVRCIENNASQTCQPQPGQANAGPDLILDGSNSTTLSGYAASSGVGIWSIASGMDGTIADITSATSDFAGAPGESYQLVWTVSNNCGSTSDTMNVVENAVPEESSLSARWGSQYVINGTSTELSNLVGASSANLRIVDNPCIKGNGMNTKVVFTFAEIADITSVEVLYHTGSSWQRVTDNASAGSSVSGLWKIFGSSFTLLTNGSSYFNNKVSELICIDALGDTIIHSNFTETTGDVCINRARHSRDGDGTYINFSSTAFVSDDDAYPVCMLDGFDRWENSSSTGSYVMVPYHSDGTPLITNGDTWSGYSWYSNHPGISGSVIHNSSPSKLQVVDGVSIATADTDNALASSTGQAYKLSFSDLQNIEQNPVFLNYGNTELSDMVLYGQELTGTTASQAQAYFGGNELNNFVFHGDSHTSGHLQSTGWDYPSQYFRLFEGRYEFTNLATAGYITHQVLLETADIINSYNPDADRNYAIIFAGANDIMATSKTPAQVYEQLMEIWSECRQAGFIVVAVTLLPYESEETRRSAINSLIQSDPSLYDLLLDIASDPDIGPYNANFGSYFNSDHIHLTEEGAGKIADLLYELIPR